MRKFALVAIAVATLALTACSSSSPDDEVVQDSVPVSSEAPAATSEGEGGTLENADSADFPTAGCESAMGQADTALEAHYIEWEGDYSDAEEQAWQRVMEPLYGACEGPDDLMAGFKAYPSTAGVTGASSVGAFWLEAFCGSQPTTYSCSGYQAVLVNY